MCHQSKKVFCVIFFEIPQDYKDYLVYLPNTQNIVYSHDVVFDKTFSSALSYSSCPYFEEIAMQQVVSYIFHTTSYYEQIGNIIPLTKFEEGKLVEN